MWETLSLVKVCLCLTIPTVRVKICVATNEMHFSVRLVVDALFIFKEDNLMKKTFKKILCTLLVVAMCLTSGLVCNDTGNLFSIDTHAVASQYAIMPLKNISVSQKAGGSYSHAGTKNVDFEISQNLYAPFDCKVVNKSTSYDAGNRIIIESTNKVNYSNGTYDYMTVMVCHDNNIDDMSMGKIIKKGTVFYHTGTYGKVTGEHVHMCVAKGKYAGMVKRSTGKWELKNSILPSDAFYIDTSTKISESGGYTWKKLPSVSVTFNANGGTASVSSDIFAEGEIYGNTMPSATRNGYTFDGWYTSATGGTRVNRSSTVTSGNKTLYAHWIENETGILEVGHIYRIYNENSGLPIASNGTGNQAHITQRNLGEKGNGELWRVVSADADGYYKFESLNGGKGIDLDVGNNKWAFGASLQVYQQKDHDAQRFSLIKRKDKDGYSGLYSIHCKNNGRAIDVADSSKNSGAELHSWDYHGGTNQLFYFEEVTTRKVEFFDNLNNNYIVSPEEECIHVNSATPKDHYSSRATDYVDVSFKPYENSIIINSLKAGSSGKDMKFYTLLNGSYNSDFYELNDATMVLNFRAKSSVSGAKIYFRWGYETTFKSVELTTEWKDYSVELPRTKISGNNIHPYIDKVCTVEMADIALYEKGTEGSLDNTDAYSTQSITADIYDSYSCEVPMPSQEKEGYTFDGWYTRRVGGAKVADAGDYYDVSNLAGTQRLYAHWVENLEPHVHNYVATTKEATCTEDGYTQYICSDCGDSHIGNEVPALDHPNTEWDSGKEPTTTEPGYTPGMFCLECETWIDGHEPISALMEYRYKVKEYITSENEYEEGYTLIDSDWSPEPTKTETVTYAKAWPSGSSTTNGFKTDSTLYKKYNTKPIETETETTKTVLGDESEAEVAGYLYWHWCYTHDIEGPINCVIGAYKGYAVSSTFSTNNFHAFFSASPLTFNDDATAYKKSSSSTCPYTYWWSALKHGVEGNIEVINNTLYTYEKEYYHYKWSEWSEWSSEPVEETDDIIVEKRINGEVFKEGYCGENVTYKLTSDGTLTISGEGPMYDFSWEDDSADGMPQYMTWEYTEWGEIIGESTIKKVVIEPGVTTIGDYAFNGCTSLESVDIADTVTSIGAVAFDYCISLKNIVIPSSVTVIKEEAFSESGLETIEIENGLETIEQMAFLYCQNLKTVILPESVTSIGDFAFILCDKLETLIINNKDCEVGTEILLTVELDEDGYPIEDENGNRNPTECPTVLKGYSGSTAEEYANTWTEAGYSIKFEALDTHEHTLYVTNTVTATCTEPGYVEYACSECNYQQTSDVVEALGHDYSEKIIDSEHLVSKATTSKKAVYKYDCSRCDSISADKTFEYGEKLNVYNFGEETYKFRNFGKHGSCTWAGHCFGMSISSAAYYLKKLDITKVGGKYPNVNGLSKNSDTIKVVCHYQNLQGSPANKAIVAGGSWYLGKGYKTESDWNAVVNYVKNHKYDNKGNLQLSFRTSSGGHAVNFLYYKQVNGQDRIYIYNNSCTANETYLYKNSKGEIREGGYTTFSGAIKCVALRDINKYLKNVSGYDKRIAYYTYADTVLIEGATAYYMDCGDEEQLIMYEIPEGQTTVKIIPLVDNATFVHMDKEYTFGLVDEDTYAEFTIPEIGEDANEAEFEIFNEHIHSHTATTIPATCTANGTIIYVCTCGDSYTEIVSATGHTFNEGEAKCNNCNYDKSDDCSCNCHKSGFVGLIWKILRFFYKLFKTNKVCGCGVAHY